MIASSQELMDVLRARRFAGERIDTGQRTEGASDRPWYVSLLLGASGWIAGIFLLAFVFLLFKPDSAGVAFVIGLLLLGAAWGLFMADREGAFVSQLAVALSIAGQVAILYGLSESLFKGQRSIAGIAFSAFVLQAILVVVMPNRLHRVLSAVFGCAAWALAVRYGLWDEPAWGRMGNDASKAAPSLLLAVAGWTIVWLPAAMALYWLIRKEAVWMARGWQTILRPVSIGLIAGLAFATLLSHPLESFPWGNSSLAERQNWLALWPLLSALATLVA